MTKKKVIFCRIGWMNNYRGIDDDCVGGGFEWVKEHKYGHEMFNFMPIGGIIHGFVRPQSGFINIERIGDSEDINSIENVLVIFFAARPHTGQLIIGWYKNAKVFKEWQNPTQDKAILVEERHEGLVGDSVGSYYITVAEKDAALLPPDERRFIVPRQKNFTGQSNVWYCDSENPATQNYVAQVIDYIDNYKSGDRINSKYFLKVLPRVDIPMVTPDLTNFNLIKDLKAKLANAPDDVDTLKKIAKIHMDSENYRWALKYISPALHINSEDWELHYWSGICNISNDDIEAAEKAYRSALKYAVNSQDKANVINRIGILQDNIEEGLKYYSEAIILDSGNCDYYYNKSQSLLDLEKPEEALDSIVSAFDLNSEDEDIVELLSSISDKLLKSARGKILLKQAFENSQNTEKIVRALAGYYLETEEKAKAKKVLALFGDNTGLSDEKVKVSNVDTREILGSISPNSTSVTDQNNENSENDFKTKAKDENTEYSSPTDLFNRLEKTSLFKNDDSVAGSDISREKYLEEEIHALIKSGILFRGELEVFELKGLPYGRQFPTDIGRLDILCHNKKTDALVVIEIKKGKSADQVIGQISRYMGYVRRNVAKPGQVVEGIIIAFDADKKLEYAMLAHDNIKIFTYHVNINELPRD